MNHQEWLEQHDQMMADHEVAMQRIDRRLDRAIRLGIREARHERKRHQELQALLKAFLERGTNGHTERP
jgi:hypothetical protein